MRWGKWEKALAAGLLSAGIATGQQPVASTPSNGTVAGSVLTLQEPGKPDQKVKVLKVHQTSDGKVAYDVQDMKTGERATIIESAAGPGTGAPVLGKPVPSAGARIRAFISSKVFGMGRSPEPTVTKTSPSMASKTVVTTEPPLMPVGMSSAAPLDSPAKEPKQPVQGRLVSAKESEKAVMTRAAEAEPAPATDWHLSWGKADNHQTPGSVKIPAPIEPKAMMPPAPTAARKPAAADEPAPKSAEAELNHQRAILQNAGYPSERERAANALAAMDWHANPGVLAALIQAAREDPAASVRAACVHNLVMMNARTDAVMAALRTLKNDRDGRVRQEVDTALVVLSGGSN